MHNIQQKHRLFATSIAIVALGFGTACSQLGDEQTQATADEAAAETVMVLASGETEAVGTENADAADDPAIWVNKNDPNASLIIGTDKKAGLYVYGLDGKAKSFLPAGALNNVEVMEGQYGILVAASDRTDGTTPHVALFLLDPKSAKLTPLERMDIGNYDPKAVGKDHKEALDIKKIHSSEAYGLCMTRADSKETDADHYTIYSALKDGAVQETSVSLNADKQLVRKDGRTWKIPTQIEGCVVTGNSLYVGEEERGIHAIDLSAAESQPQLVIKADEKNLVADVEGLTIADLGQKGRYLFASSQGDNSYAVYRLPDHEYIGRFRIGDGDSIDGTSETDGIAVTAEPVGDNYPHGIFVAQDGDNGDGTQNFKYVDLAKIWEALKVSYR